MGRVVFPNQSLPQDSVQYNGTRHPRNHAGFFSRPITGKEMFLPRYGIRELKASLSEKQHKVKKVNNEFFQSLTILQLHLAACIRSVRFNQRTKTFTFTSSGADECVFTVFARAIKLRYGECDLCLFFFCKDFHFS